MGKKTVALILAGGAGTRLDILSKHRAKPAVPFGGKYRIIDFALSNCVNSGIYTVGILTQYLPRSLSEHIGIGRPWDLDRSFGGVTLLPPYQRSEGDWYNGTANSVYQNLNYVMDHKSKNTLILAGDHIYKMNYQKMIRNHEKTGADLTVAVKEVPMENTSQFGILEVDSENKIIEFQEKPKEAKSNLASMGIYIFKTELLKELLLKYCGPNGGEDFGKHIIPKMIGEYKVFAYKFKGYWRDVGTIEEYWKANIELVSDYPPVDLYEEDFKIHTKSEELPPVKFGKEGSAVRSLISNGCRINGKVENSVISPGVVVEKGAVVRNSIIFNGTIINKDTIIDRSIIDKKVVIGKNCRIGIGTDYTPNKEISEKLYSGINLIGKFACVPDSTYIERNCRIMSRVEESEYKSNRVRSGGNIHSEKEGGIFDMFLI
ncbi:glucose-1-phosphate adenylyltransferase [Haliovirga abyssi]|uniref:Glucose-1-phosphate adenylyltransferase n=1 Tax=Haliovirga abyssi TaxID=2996794 RepID=A0AAU9D8F6_9FUSO|nr:glucose-1-phosphate adenylyltransferase [Haliovirga abyssi]BDU49866.1 glucose-1-phosphate adenylyltransferase [Haliovirga abyssi]